VHISSPRAMSRPEPALYGSTSRSCDRSALATGPSSLRSRVSGHTSSAFYLHPIVQFSFTCCTLSRSARDTLPVVRFDRDASRTSDSRVFAYGSASTLPSRSTCRAPSSCIFLNRITESRSMPSRGSVHSPTYMAIHSRCLCGMAYVTEARHRKAETSTPGFCLRLAGCTFETLVH
jgi:hypothetical protein